MPPRCWLPRRSWRLEHNQCHGPFHFLLDPLPSDKSPFDLQPISVVKRETPPQREVRSRAVEDKTLVLGEPHCPTRRVYGDLHFSSWRGCFELGRVVLEAKIHEGWIAPIAINTHRQ